ncbi:MAG: sigma-70 family RNA polymerase sigma factor [Bacilli bacterium]
MEKEFDRLYNQTYQSVLKYVIAKTDNLSNIEDIMQNIYLKLYEVITKKGCKYIENEFYFLIKLAHNELYKYYSLKNKCKHIFVGDYSNFDTFISNDTHHDYELEIEDKIDLESIWKIIDQESEDIKRIIYLYYLGDMTINNIAIILKQNANTIKTKLYRTINKIRKSIGGVHSGENERNLV